MEAVQRRFLPNNSTIAQHDLGLLDVAYDAHLGDEHRSCKSKSNLESLMHCWSALEGVCKGMHHHTFCRLALRTAGQVAHKGAERYLCVVVLNRRSWLAACCQVVQELKKELYQCCGGLSALQCVGMA